MIYTAVKRCKATMTFLSCIALAYAAEMAAPDVCHPQTTQTYRNVLKKIDAPLPILADHPDFVEPLRSDERFLAPPVVDDSTGGIVVRSWRYWYNARGIIEMANRLDPRATAIVNLMAWGIDDGGGIRSPEPSGVVLAGTPEKNALYIRQVEEIVNPFIERMSGCVVLVAHTLPGHEDSVRKLLYPSISTDRGQLDIKNGTRKLHEIIMSHSYIGSKPEEALNLDSSIPLTSYFLKTPSSHASAGAGESGFEKIPIPLVRNLYRCPNDIVFYDGDGYDRIRDYLKRRGIRHLLVMGFIEKPTILPTHPRAEAESGETAMTDRTCCDDATARRVGTAVDIERLGRDFNIFLVGDAIRTTFPGSVTPRYATQAILATLAGDYMITQVGWVAAAER